MKQISKEERDKLLAILTKRFEKHVERHKGIVWEEVLTRLDNHPEKLWSLYQMEETEGEPDVIGKVAETGEFIFVDCSPESPKGRRSLCYDPAALESRKEHKPSGSAIGMANEMGVKILDEQEYRHLQTLGRFDTKTSTWILTPEDIRERGGALFCDWRYGHVFTYHNGAESYYASRAFRAILTV